MRERESRARVERREVREGKGVQGAYIIIAIDDTLYSLNTLDCQFDVKLSLPMYPTMRMMPTNSVFLTGASFVS